MRYELREEDNGYRYMRHLIRVDDDGTETLLGSDGGEPEDQSFGRDWAWVPEELNRLAALCDEHRMMREANGSSLRDETLDHRVTRERLNAKISELAGFLREANTKNDRLERIFALWEQWFIELKDKMSASWPPEAMP